MLFLIDFLKSFDIFLSVLYNEIKGVLMKNWLQEKTVVVTGASSGIGKEICRRLIVCYNVNVIGVGRSEEKMLAFQQELGEYAQKFTYRLFDVSQRESWMAFAEELNKNGTEVTLLINNAGMFPTFSRALNTPVETIERILKVNFYSAVYGAEAFKDIVFKNPKGGIVNVCSSGALCTVAGTAAYSSSKAALKAYTEALMIEEKGKYVAIMYPGTTKTELFRNDKQTENSALDLIAMKPSKMARKIVRKIRHRRKRAVLGVDAKMMNFVAKIAPVKGIFLIRNVMKAAKSKVFKNVFDEGEKKQ